MPPCPTSNRSLATNLTGESFSIHLSTVTICAVHHLNSQVLMSDLGGGLAGCRVFL